MSDWILVEKTRHDSVPYVGLLGFSPGPAMRAEARNALLIYAMER